MYKRQLKPGTVALDDKQVINQEVRRSTITRVNVERDQWIMKKLLLIAQKANEHFQYDLTNGILEPAQIATYDAKDEGQYNWHLDIGPKVLTRKLSISIPLNDEKDFSGGELQFNYGKPVTQEQVAGTAIVFPSYVLHKVSPVTKGCRYSLVTWVHGPAWR